MAIEPGVNLATGLAPHVEVKLDLLLAGWAEQHRLSPHQADTVRLAVTRADAAWWRELFGQVGRLACSVNGELAPLISWPPPTTPARTYLRWVPARP
jgi:hypothetical protein